jgi:hypothetical protein
MNMNWQRALALLVALTIAQAASAQGRGNGKSGERKSGKHGSAAATKHAPQPVVVVVDQDGHRRIFHDYYRQRSLPPGLAKKQSLPPGLAKQLRERGQLPPGLQKHLIEVPGPLQVRMQPLPPHYHRYFAGRDLIVVDSPANRIVAIIRDVLG